MLKCRSHINGLFLFGSNVVKKSSVLWKKTYKILIEVMGRILAQRLVIRHLFISKINKKKIEVMINFTIAISPANLKWDKCSYFSCKQDNYSNPLTPEQGNRSGSFSSETQILIENSYLKALQDEICLEFYKKSVHLCTLSC